MTPQLLTSPLLCILVDPTSGLSLVHIGIRGDHSIKTSLLIGRLTVTLRSPVGSAGVGTNGKDAPPVAYLEARTIHLVNLCPNHGTYEDSPSFRFGRAPHRQLEGIIVGFPKGLL